MVVVEDRDRLMTPGEVATLFRVDPKTVNRWAKLGKIASLLTPGGHHRFRRSVVAKFLETAAPAPSGEIPRQPQPEDVRR